MCQAPVPSGLHMLCVPFALPGEMLLQVDCSQLLSLWVCVEMTLPSTPSRRAGPPSPGPQAIPPTNLFSSQHLLLFQLRLLICLLISHLLLSLALGFFKTGHGVLLLWQPQTWV